MKIAVAGSSGLIGSSLIRYLTTYGHTVLRLVRRSPGKGEVFWNPKTQTIELSALEGIDALVNLAGENVATGRWTPAKKQRILESRTKGTQVLSTTLASMTNKPAVFVCASAVGYYGDRREEVLDETSASGDNFLADVCRQWEESTQPAAEAGIRVVNGRFGVALSPNGGALKKMLTPFRLGLGGPLGNGSQWMSWVAIDDLVSAIRYLIENDLLAGPVNVVSPNPVTNREFTRILARVLGRPAIFPLPGCVLNAMFGEMAAVAMLASQRVLPARLIQSGFEFKYPKLESTLRHLLGVQPS